MAENKLSESHQYNFTNTLDYFESDIWATQSRIQNIKEKFLFFVDLLTTPGYGMHATSKIKFNGIVPFYLKCRRLLFINFESNKIGNLTMKILLLSQNEKKLYLHTNS